MHAGRGREKRNTIAQDIYKLNREFKTFFRSVFS